MLLQWSCSLDSGQQLPCRRQFVSECQELDRQLRYVVLKGPRQENLNVLLCQACTGMQVADGTQTQPRQPNMYCTGVIAYFYNDAVLLQAELQAANWHKL